MEVCIRKGSVGDAEAIAGLCEQLGYHTCGEEMQKRMLVIFEREDHCIFVVTISENVIAWSHSFLSLRIESGSFVEIGGLVVDQDYRKKGIGKLLVQEIMKWAQTKNTKLRVRCNIIRKDAHEFYKGTGFKELKEQKVFEMEL